ncbi:MAG: hypothetical protein QW117_02090 [Candidatus Pacearchaeota archaeon]
MINEEEINIYLGKINGLYLFYNTKKEKILKYDPKIDSVLEVKEKEILKRTKGLIKRLKGGKNDRGLLC